MYARDGFMSDTVGDLESSHPEAVKEMLTHIGSLYLITADGKVVSKQSQKIKWDPTPPAGLTNAFAEYSFAKPSAAAFAITSVDTFMVLSKPFAAELPRVFLDIITQEPAGAMAHSYRLYVRTVLMPLYRRVAEILNAHSAAVRSTDPHAVSLFSHWNRCC